MSSEWNGLYVLRRIVEDDPLYHRVYMSAREAGGITEKDNWFSKGPYFVEKRDYNALRSDPNHAWPVSLANNPTVLMGVFQLRRH